MKYHVLVYDNEKDRNTKDSVDVQDLSKLDVEIHYLKKENQSFKSGSLYAFYIEVMQIPDNEVIILLVGGNTFAHQYVLQEIDRMYSKDNAMVTYGGSLSLENDSFVKDEEVALEEIMSKEARKYSRKDVNLMTFYAGLFKKLPLTDLLIDGFFPEEGYEYSLMLSMLEIAEERGIHSKDILHLSKGVSHQNISKKVCIQDTDSAIDNIT